MEQEFEKQFENPDSQFRGAPFWAWNCKLDKEMMTRQIEYFKEMGLGGFHMHCRTGLDTPYMSEEYLEVVKACVEKAKQEKMYAWLYDEDRWPSGAAGGLVTKDRQYRARYLVFCPWKQEEMPPSHQTHGSSMRHLAQQGNGKLLSRYQVQIQDGVLKSYKRLSEGEEIPCGGQIWYVYEEIAPDSGWFNDQAYLDTLNPKAVERFIEETHEAYYRAVGEEFGKTVPAIFTDEPQFAHKTSLGFAEEKKYCILPFTDDFEESYRKQYGTEFLDTLPEVFWEKPDGQVSKARYLFHDHIAQRFAEAFADTLGKWCEEHGIMLTGHMMAEGTLGSQTGALGEAMRSYRSFQQPGIDMLSDKREYSTAKQAQSAGHQYGRKGITSELYGVTNWDFDFRGHKLQGDWQAALGVTLRVHHLAWASMAGEAKRDYPASIFYQSPWYKEYPYIEDHFARVNTALRSGKPEVHIGVIHPVESMWLLWGPQEQTAAAREQLEEQFDETVHWLLLSQLDFDFIAESLLPELNHGQVGDRFQVGEMVYDTVLVPGCLTMRRSTLERLKAFRKAGGKVVFMGAPAKYVDAEPSEEVREFAAECEMIRFSHTELLEAMEDVRQISIHTADGRMADRYLYQMRDDADGKWLFIAQGLREDNIDVPQTRRLTIRLKGEYAVEEYDTLHGTHHPLNAEIQDGYTVLVHEMSDHDSLLLRLMPGKASSGQEMAREPQYIRVQKPWGRMPITLSEPNVLLLDMAEASLDGEEWAEKEEVLRIDNILRQRLGFPLKMEAFAQPWTRVKEKAQHTLSLRYTVDSAVEVPNAYLAVEKPEDCTIAWNGEEIDNTPVGYYTDASIQTVPLGTIRKGENILQIEMPYKTETNVEWCYILGDFGVQVAGDHATVTEPVRELYFGDWTVQGLPFYGGNVTYHTEVTGNGEECLLQVSKYRNPLLSVEVDGHPAGKLAFAPYKLPLGKLEGTHSLDITAYGNRVNSFGTVHLCDEKVTWFGPMAWRSAGESWSYEYQLRRTGVLSAPVLYLEKK